jgi:hypothetical protein
MTDWQPIESAPKDGRRIWAAFRDDIYPDLMPGRGDLERWNGVQVPLRYICAGQEWSIAAPVGHGGFPDEWIAGWMPLPAPPKDKP